MTTQVKLMLGAAVVIVAVAIASLVSNAKIRSLERVVDEAKQQAKVNEESAVAAEIKAGEYKQKIEHLETELGKIAAVARRQDAELEKIDGDVGDARGRVERARRVRAIGASVEELCGQLEGLGYPC